MFDAFFLPAEPAERFCIFHPPGGPVPAARGIVYVHPFAEEMNKARRMAALQATALARSGYAVLQLDLLGCGDSSGDFADARWEIWKKDVRAALAWLGQRVAGPLSLWGLRLGGTLAADVARDADLNLEQLLLWHPVVDGQQFLTQFLRLRLAAEMLTSGASQSGVGGLRQTLQAGAVLEIAGYELHPALASAIDALKLADLVPAVKSMHWLEVAASGGNGVSPASQRALQVWRGEGVQVQAASVAGDPFWSTVEIAECAALLVATTQAMQPAT